MRMRYKNCLNKSVFIRENIYQSNVWILLLFSVVLTVGNIVFDRSEPEIILENEVSRLEKLTSRRYNEMSNMDFHIQYILTKSDEEGYDFLTLDLQEYYDSVAILGYQDNANIALGLYLAKVGKANEASNYLKKVNSYDEPYYYYARSFTITGNDLSSDSMRFDLLSKEINNHEKSRKLAYVELSKLLEPNEFMPWMPDATELPDFHTSVEYTLKRKTLFLSQKYAEYFASIISNISATVSVINVIAAALIFLVWLLYFIQLSFLDKISSVLVLMTILLQSVAILLVFPISDYVHYVMGLWNSYSSYGDMFMHTLFGIGLVEEIVKIIPIIPAIFLYNRKEPYQILFYAAVSALTFAFIENLIYFEKGINLTMHARSLTATIGHVVDSVIIAYGIVVIHQKRLKIWPPFTFLIFLILGALAHAIYDFLIFAHLYLYFFLFIVLTSRILITLLNNAINNSQNFSYNKLYNHKKVQFTLVFSLSLVLVFEYFTIGFQKGIEEANSSFFDAMFSGSLIMFILGSKLSSINAVKGYWGKINFSANPFSEDNVAQNFVNQKIDLIPYYSDHGLSEFLPEGTTGNIISRMPIRNKQKNFFMSYVDTEWFVVNLEDQIQEEGYYPKHILLKFREKQSSLNNIKRFQAHLLLIPADIKSKKSMPLRTDFKSLGWVFVSKS